MNRGGFGWLVLTAGLVSLATCRSNGAEPELKPGQRAFAIRVDQVRLPTGFIFSGARVDVLLTSKKEGKVVARTILQNVFVLVGDTQVQDEKDKTVRVHSTVTLELSPEQGELLAAAKQKGQLTLILRANPDKKKERLVLPPGQRAMAIRISQDKVAGGFVLPSAWIDVILITKARDGKEVARIILEKLLVLAVDDQRDKSAKSFFAGFTVVLAVTGKEAEILAAAMEEGQLSLALRAKEDAKTSKE